MNGILFRNEWFDRPIHLSAVFRIPDFVSDIFIVILRFAIRPNTRQNLKMSNSLQNRRQSLIPTSDVLE